MRIAGFFLPLLFLFSQQSCDLASMFNARPEQVKASFQQALSPYFPNARVEVLPAQQTLEAFACTRGTGPQLTQEVAKFIRTNPQVGQLRTLRNWGNVLSAPSYRYVGIVFDTETVAYDVDTGAIAVVPTEERIRQGYNTICGFSDTPGGQVAPGTSYIWVGQFHVTFAQPYQGRTSTEVFDTLGFSSNDDFQWRSNAEIQHRIATTKQYFIARGANISEVRFIHANKVFPPAGTMKQQ
jgi:hypothetical protein